MESGEKSGTEFEIDACRDRMKVRCMDGWMERGRGDRRVECVTVKDGGLNSDHE